jgi:hypothetical protein
MFPPYPTKYTVDGNILKLIKGWLRAKVVDKGGSDHSRRGDT